MKPVVDKAIFGPWAIVTGASSGIGRAIAEHLGASGLHLVLVARRRQRLEQLGRELADRFGVASRVVDADLAEEASLDALAQATADLDIGLVVGNAGFANPGELLKLDRSELLRAVRLKVTTNLTLVHHFGQKLLARKRGGVLLVSSDGRRSGGDADEPMTAERVAWEGLRADRGR